MSATRPAAPSSSAEEEALLRPENRPRLVKLLVQLLHEEERAEARASATRRVRK